jgi:hypothetical protein
VQKFLLPQRQATKFCCFLPAWPLLPWPPLLLPRHNQQTLALDAQKTLMATSLLSRVGVAYPCSLDMHAAMRLLRAVAAQVQIQIVTCLKPSDCTDAIDSCRYGSSIFESVWFDLLLLLFFRLVSLVPRACPFTILPHQISNLA